jgi:hypothetical protein
MTRAVERTVHEPEIHLLGSRVAVVLAMIAFVLALSVFSGIVLASVSAGLLVGLATTGLIWLTAAVL